MEDIVPGLLETLRQQFGENIDSNKEIAALLKEIQAGTGTYLHAADYAEKVGGALSKAFGTHITSEILPDGRMYFNIADRTIRPLLTESHNLISDATVQVQTALNAKADIGIKAQSVPVNTDRIDGIVQKVADAENYDDVAWVLDEPIKTLSRAIVFDTLKANMQFQSSSGLPTVVQRVVRAGCCAWCEKVGGPYIYPDVPDEIYRGHDRCRCYVDFDINESMGKRQTVVLQKKKK